MAETTANSDDRSDDSDAMPAARKELGLEFQPAPRVTTSIKLQLQVRMLEDWDDSFRGFSGEDYPVEKERKAYAMLVVNRTAVERLLALSVLFWEAHKLGLGLCQMVYAGSELQVFLESYTGRRYGNVTAEEVRAIMTLFEDRNVPIKSFKRAPHGLPAQGTVPCKDCKLVVIDTGSFKRPDMVDYFWLATVKETNAMIRTSSLKQEDVQELLMHLS